MDNCSKDNCPFFVHFTLCVGVEKGFIHVRKVEFNMDEQLKKKKSGFKLMAQLLLVVSIPMVILFAFAITAIQSVSTKIAENMVQHELNAAQYAFEVAVGNISKGTYMYTNGRFYKGKSNLTDNTEFFDNFSAEVDLEVAIVFGDTYVATSLVDESGVRIIGTTVEPKIVEAVINQGKDYYSDQIKIGGKTYYGMYCPLKQYNSDEIVGMTFVGLERSTVSDIYRKQMISSSVLLCIIVALGIVLTVLFVIKLLKAIRKVIGHLGEVAQGNLDIQMGEKLLNRSDEIGDIARSVEAQIQSLGSIVSNILHTADNLDQISGGFSQSFGKMTEYIGSVETAVGEMANGSIQQAQDTQNVGNEMQSMGDAIDSTSNNVDHLVGSTERMREYNRSVDNTLLELIRISEETKQAFDVVYEQTNETNQSAQKIQSAADVITDIASQTNLLSLNASIEAARAGEHGKGFAVVADEIRKLAEQSRESASQITGIIEMLIQNSNTTVNTMKHVTDIISKQGEELQQTKTVFGDLHQEIGEVSDAVDNIRGEVEQLNTLKTSVLGAVGNLAAIAEENAASTQETSTSMQELGNIVNDCSKDVDQILNMSEILAENTSQFTLRKSISEVATDIFNVEMKKEK